MILLLLVGLVEGVQFGYEVERGQSICFEDYFSQDDVFDLRVRANSSNYSVKLEESEQKKYVPLYERSGAWEHNYQHQSNHKTSHMKYCFINLENDGILFNITYKTGSELADMQKVAKISDLNQMGGHMKKLNSMLDDIKRERSFLIAKYDFLSRMQGSISKKQIVFGLMCLGISLIITAITVNLIKRILQQKKSQ
ncbi:unnamed protein product (macronuclear) [Paramecium tetraurelia]|uniref:GOLD domain-containing protein n=1 Tax=Paramecium tetraurelia TaxID=5888 RepID=A0CKN2_PARTE|nr:uncharacterized protein GSPATT00001063001 [Paramecium tetraurelia]CAK71349.1 unnamed protein product [Paramecium tetraurelia]|eukprot:XP_001438746.1 hypothetical protein (macronuclear) [Paramecium tetraurelia strain d4-2]